MKSATRLVLSYFMKLTKCRASASISSIVCGMLFGVIWWNYQLMVIDPHYPAYQTITVDLDSLAETDYNSWLTSKGVMSKPLTEEEVSFRLGKDVLLESEFLKREVPVLCIVISKGRNKATAVKDTWAKHCNQVVFYGAYTDNVIPVIRYSSPESSHVTFCRIIVQLQRKFSGKFKWFLMAEDSSYVLVENARHYVAPLNHSLPYYLGRTVAKYSTPPYNSPESGILISSGAFDLLTEYFSDFESCRQKSFHNESMFMSRKYEESLGIIFNKDPLWRNLSSSAEQYYSSKPVDTRDSKGRVRFMAFHPEKHLIKGSISIFNSFWRSNAFPVTEGLNCCSDLAISFNGLTPSQLYLTEYLLYRLSPYRNSPLGLGNKKPKYSRKSMSSSLLGIRDMEVGIPVVKSLDKKTDPKYIQRAGSLSDLFNDVF